MNILFTCVGRRVELIQEFKKQSTDDRKVTVFGTDIDSTAPAAMFCDEVLIVPKIQDQSYIPTLLEICKKNQIDVLIPTIDTDLLLLSKSRIEFEELGTKVLISEYSFIQKCRDKRYTGEIFEKADLHYPKCFCDERLYSLEFPAFIKPLDGSSSINTYKVMNKDELHEYARKIGDYIIQPFVDGEEYTIDIFCDLFGKPIYITPRKRLAIRSGEVLKTEICQDGEMIEEAMRLIAVTKPCGPITVQLIKERTTGVNWYIEINPRFGGGAPLSMKAGANSAKALSEIMEGYELRYMPNAAEDHAIFSRFDQSVKIK